MTTLDTTPRRLLVSHAPPAAFAPMTRVLLARLGYAVLEPEDFAQCAEKHGRPDCLLVDERNLADLEDDGGPPVPVVALTGRHGVTGADSRVVGALRRPVGIHELYRVLQQVLEETPRSVPRVPTHLPASCQRNGSSWAATVLMLSENGCLLRTPDPLLLGSRMELAFSLPRAGQLKITAEVAYQLVPDVGLIFDALSPNARRQIAGFVTEALGAL